MKVHFIAISQNAKIGPIPVSMVERASCWPGCALYGNGCYAETGALAMHWDRVSRGEAGGSWSEFCAKIAALRPRPSLALRPSRRSPRIRGQDRRRAPRRARRRQHRQERYRLHSQARARRRSCRYREPVPIAAAIKAGFTVNLSANNSANADRLAELGIAPVVTVLARAYARRAIRHRFKRRRDEWAERISEWRDRTASLPRDTPAGRRIAICPATYSDATCKSCGACAHVRNPVIGFPAHGAWRQVEAVMAARDVPAGESWAFPEHRTMAEVLAEETATA
jgi:hypothetical protein